MLTSFFKKSKPINFLLVGFLMLLYFLFVNFFFTENIITWSYTFKKIGLLLVYLFLMVLINFIVKRNRVTKKNTFTIFFFAVFSMMFLPILKSSNVLLAALFVLLSLRRIVSLRSGLYIKKKIFDASFWIGFAFLFYPESILFITLPFVGIILYATNDFKNWLIPFFALGTVYILKTCFDLLMFQQYFNPFAYFDFPLLSFLNYHSAKIILPISVLLTFTVWVLFYFFKSLQNATRNLKTTFYLILVAWLISIIVIIFSQQKTGAELLFFIIPVCIMGANYYQQKGEKLFKEILLVSLLLLTILVPFIAF